MFGVNGNDMFVFIGIILGDIFYSKIVWFSGFWSKNNFFRVVIKCVVDLIFSNINCFFCYLVEVIIMRSWVIKVVI